jgi:cell division protein ZapE
MTASLLDRAPTMSGAEIAGSLMPPRQFDDATLDDYRPDADYPSQAEAVERVRAFAAAWKGGGGGLFKKKAPEQKPGLYLDGGFGVGKTHLLVALWKLAPGRKYFGTFIEYTALVGALGYQATVQLLSGASFLAIDEFELDDPGDTMLMTRLLGELVASGTRIAATSNTPPNALGEGRFAAADFLREINALAARFDIVRIDGLDYRRRDIEGHAVALQDDAALEAAAAALPGVVTVDDFDAVLRHLGTVHPSRYVKLVSGLTAVGLRGVHVLENQTDALRFVAAVDRLYDGQVRVLATGVPLDQVFGDEMLAGGYRKKYQRAISRLIALTS